MGGVLISPKPEGSTVGHLTGVPGALPRTPNSWLFSFLFFFFTLRSFSSCSHLTRRPTGDIERRGEILDPLIIETETVSVEAKPFKEAGFVMQNCFPPGSPLVLHH